MEEAIHKNIAVVLWMHQNVVGRGSGLLISRNLILTCAHNFFNRNREMVDLSFYSIYPGQSGKLVDPYRIESIYIPKEFHPHTRPV